MLPHADTSANTVRPDRVASTDPSASWIAPWILAADPSVPGNGPPITTQVRIPRESWRPGPIGSRVQVADYDTSTEAFYGRVSFDPELLKERPGADDLASSDYQACNLFATAMAITGQFEAALGRRIGFATDTHQIKLVPHAFAGANAFYDRHSEAIIFGYFRDDDGHWVDTSLSYDIIAHEMTHAILDGLRPRFTDPSSADQAAFHEAFADIVAILSTLTRREVTVWAIGHLLWQQGADPDRVPLDRILETLSSSFVSAIAPQVGQALAQREALRNSFDLLDDHRRRSDDDFSLYASRQKDRQPHELGEVLVAAVLGAFRDLLRQRLHDVMPASAREEPTPIELVADEAARAAELLLTVCIQAIDYTPPVHVLFPDYLSALLTVHRELYGPAPRIDLGAVLRRSFGCLGIEPATKAGPWRPFDSHLDHSGVRLDQIQVDRDEAFRFVFANWVELGLDPASYVRVLSVRPSLRISPDDGFLVHETIIECLERLRLSRGEFRLRLGLGSEEKGSTTDNRDLDLRGGITLVLGDHGQVKYVIHKHLVPRTGDGHRRAAADRVGYIDELVDLGFVTGRVHPADFAELHRLARRSRRLDPDDPELWW